jgi:hypothetical protein
VGGGRKTTAVSIDRRNTLTKLLCRRIITQSLPRPLVELSSNRIESVLVSVRKIHSFREVLPKQSVGAFVRATLPGLLWITEVHLDVGLHRNGVLLGRPRRRFRQRRECAGETQGGYFCRRALEFRFENADSLISQPCPL